MEYLFFEYHVRVREDDLALLVICSRPLSTLPFGLSVVLPAEDGTSEQLCENDFNFLREKRLRSSCSGCENQKR